MTRGIGAVAQGQSSRPPYRGVWVRVPSAQLVGGRVMGDGERGTGNREQGTGNGTSAAVAECRRATLRPSWAKARGGSNPSGGMNNQVRSSTGQSAGM